MPCEMLEYDRNVIADQTIQIWWDTMTRPVRFPPTYPNVPICEWLCEVGIDEDGTLCDEPDDPNYVDPLLGQSFTTYSRDDYLDSAPHISPETAQMMRRFNCRLSPPVGNTVSAERREA